jgi:hypothetical protein
MLLFCVVRLARCFPCNAVLLPTLKIGVAHMKAWIRTLLMFLAVSLDASTATADAAHLCVRPVASRGPMDGPTAYATGTIVSRRTQGIAPSVIDLPPGGKFPLIYDAFTEQLSNGEKRNRTFFWRLDLPAELVGPYDLDDREIREKITFDENGASAADTSGRILFLVGSYGENGSERVWRQQLYSQDWGQRPILFKPDPHEKIGEPRGIFWSDLQRAFLVQDVNPEPSTGGVQFRANLLTSAGVEVLNGYDMDFAADLPALGVTALLGSNRLTFIDHEGVATSLGRMKPAPEGRTWNGIYETRDKGWLFVDGGKYDYAVRVEQIDGRWRLASLIRLVNDEGNLDRSEDQLEEVSKIVRVNPCRSFSAAIRRMILCRGQIQELRSGALSPIGSKEQRLTRYLGDATHLGLALFQDEEGKVYGYDGDRLHRVNGTLPDRVFVQDLPSSRRTFLSTVSSLLELKREGQELRLEELTVPSHQSDLLLARFYHFSGDVVALLRQGAFVVDGAMLKPVWVPDEPERIDTTSKLKPTYVSQLSGLLFASRKAVSAIPELQLLTHCLSSN